MKHTQGEWTAEKAILKVSGVDVYEVASMPFWVAKVRGDDEEQMKANARLIAAAPNLLDALQDAFDYPKDDMEAWAKSGHPITVTFQPIHFKKALAAIAKATKD